MSDLRELLGDRYKALTTAISETVSDWLGHDTPSSPHGWRCEDKTRYPGPCGHDGQMADEVMGVLEAILPDLLAQAWAEKDREPVCGHCNGERFGQGVPWPCPTLQALDGGGTDE